MQNVKLVMIGDGSVGKTTMLITYTTGGYPQDYVPTVFDNYSANVMAPGDQPVSLGLWDTAGQEDFDRLRPLSYPGTDVFVLSYAINSRSSFENLEKWLAEVNHHVPGTPVLVVGCKSDLESDRQVLAAEGKDYARRNNAKFIETSSLKNENLKECFDLAIEMALSGGGPTKTGCFPFSCFSGAAASIDSEDQAPPVKPKRDDPYQHTDSIWCLARGPGSTLFSGSRDFTVRQWDIHTGVCRRIFMGHSQQIYNVLVHEHRFEPLLVSCSSDSTCRVWPLKPQASLISASSQLTSESSSEKTSLDFLSSSSDDDHSSSMKVSPVPITSEAMFVLQHDDSVNAALIYFDDLFTCSNDKTVRRWDLNTGKRLSVFRGSKSELNCMVATSESSSLIYCGCADGRLRAWRLTSPEVPLFELRGHTASINFMEIGVFDIIVTADASGGVCTWDSANGAALHVLRGHRDAINAMSISEGLVYTASRDHTLRCFNIASGECQFVAVGSTSSLRAVSAGQGVVVSAGKDGTIRCYDGDSGELLWDFDGHEDYLNKVFIDPVAKRGHISRQKTVARNKSFKRRHRSRKISQKEKLFRMSSMVGLDSLDRSASLREKSTHKKYLSVDEVFGDSGPDEYVRVFTAGREGLIRSWDVDTGKSLGVFGNAASKRRGLLHTRNAFCRPELCHGRLVWKTLATILALIGTGTTLMLNFVVFSEEMREDTDSSRHAEPAVFFKHFLQHHFIHRSWTVSAGYVNVFVGIIEQAVDFLQLISFAFIQNAIPWPDIHPIFSIAPTFQLNLDLPQFGFTFLFAFVCIYAFLFLLTFLNSYRIAQDDNKSRFVAIIWSLSKLLAWSCSTVLFIPISRNLLSVFSCGFYQATFSNDLNFSECYDETHIILMAAAVAVLMFFLPLAVRLASVNGELSRVSVFFWKTWEFDKPDLRKIHFVSRRSSKFNRLDIALKVVLLCLTIFVREAGTTTVGWLLLVVGLLLFVPSLYEPPFHFPRMNIFRSSLLCGVVWTFAMAVAVASSASDAQPSDALVTAHLALLPVAFFVGGWMMHRRMKSGILRAYLVDMRAKLPPEPEHDEESNGAAATVDNDIDEKDGKRFCSYCGTRIPISWWSNHIVSLKHTINVERGNEQVVLDIQEEESPEPSREGASSRPLREPLPLTSAPQAPPLTIAHSSASLPKAPPIPPAVPPKAPPLPRGMSSANFPTAPPLLQAAAPNEPPLPVGLSTPNLPTAPPLPPLLTAAPKAPPLPVGLSSPSLPTAPPRPPLLTATPKAPPLPVGLSSPNLPKAPPLPPAAAPTSIPTSARSTENRPGSSTASTFSKLPQSFVEVQCKWCKTNNGPSRTICLHCGHALPKMTDNPILSTVRTIGDSNENLENLRCKWCSRACEAWQTTCNKCGHALPSRPKDERIPSRAYAEALPLSNSFRSTEQGGPLDAPRLHENDSQRLLLTSIRDSRFSPATKLPVDTSSSNLAASHSSSRDLLQTRTLYDLDRFFPISASVGQRDVAGEYPPLYHVADPTFDVNAAILADNNAPPPAYHSL